MAGSHEKKIGHVEVPRVEISNINEEQSLPYKSIL